jgi:uncharacterized protein YdcH (DUF465 family)
MKPKKIQSSSKSLSLDSALNSSVPRSSKLVPNTTSYFFNRFYREHKRLDSEIATLVARGVSTWAESDKITELKKLKLKYKELLGQMSS